MRLNDFRLALFLSIKFLLKSKKASLLLIILIIVASFTNIVFFLSVFEGVNDRLDRNIRDFLTSDIKIEQKQEGTLIDNVGDLKNKLLNIDGVVGVSSFIQFPVYATYKNRTRYFDMRSVSEDDEAARIKIRDTLKVGEYLDKLDAGEIVIGKDVAGKYGSYLEEYSLKTDLGEKITIDFGNNISKQYQVKGVLDANIYDIDLQLFIPQQELEMILGVKDKATAIVVKTEPGKDILKIKREILNLNLGENVFLWSERRGLSTSLSSSFNLLELVVGTISLFVAAFSIIIVLYLNMIQKTKHIGLMKAIGINMDSIILSYVFQSIFYSIAGMAISIVFLLLLIIPYFNANPIPFPIGIVTPIIKKEFILIAAVSFIIISILSGFIPSKKLLKKKAITLLQGERF